MPANKNINKACCLIPPKVEDPEMLFWDFSITDDKLM